MVSHPELCSDTPIGSDRDSGRDSYALKTELLCSRASRPFLSNYAMKIELLGSGALRPFLRSYALKTELLGFGAP